MFDMDTLHNKAKEAAEFELKRNKIVFSLLMPVSDEFNFDEWHFLEQYDNYRLYSKGGKGNHKKKLIQTTKGQFYYLLK
jgi:hypothetical protein